MFQELVGVRFPECVILSGKAFEEKQLTFSFDSFPEIEIDSVRPVSNVVLLPCRTQMMLSF